MTPRQRELKKEAERIGAAYDREEMYGDPKLHRFSSVPVALQIDYAENQGIAKDECWYCGKNKAAHGAQEKKS